MIDREEVLQDVASMAYVAADIREGRHTPHELHQTFDICEGDNLERVSRVMEMAIAEVAAATASLSAPDLPREDIGNPVIRDLARRYAHEYVVARILADWLGITLPDSATVWKEKAGDAMARLSRTMESLSGQLGVYSRRVPPI